MTDREVFANVNPGGYRLQEEYWATRYPQGGRNVYSTDLTLAQIVAHIQAPDPSLDPDEALKRGNRKIDLKHAEDFARYIREENDWVSPPLLLRAPGDLFTFEPYATEPSMFGILSIPKLALGEIRILDGQHRILGLHLALEQIGAELDEQRTLLAKARRNNETSEVIAHFESQIQALQDQRAKFAEQRMTLQFVIEDDQRAYFRIFADIADNAKGIGGALRTTMDTRKVVNRATEPLLTHPLLQGRVDLHTDSVRGTSPYLLSARHVAEIVRTVAKGIGGRIGRRDEQELDEGHLVQDTQAFFDVIHTAYPDLQQVAAGRKTPMSLRDTSLLGSVTILRVLAGAYHDLRQKGLSEDQIAAAFASMPMAIPIDHSERGFWMPASVFQEPWRAPLARGGNLKRLTSFIVDYAKSVAGVGEATVAD